MNPKQQRNSAKIAMYGSAVIAGAGITMLFTDAMQYTIGIALSVFCIVFGCWAGRMAYGFWKEV